MTKINIQIYSDIHLELLSGIPKIKPLCKYLFLAGDIGSINKVTLFTFLDYCSINWTKVYYVAGNHEYYIPNTKFIELTEQYISIIKKKYNNIFFLHDQSIELDENINIYGSTLWTQSDNSDYLNDINFVDRHMINTISKMQLDKLMYYLQNNKKKTIIMTHFPPTQNTTSHPKHSNQDQNIKNYFAWSSLLSKLQLDNIICWISGHTHFSYDFIEYNVRCISNQFGYRNEIHNTNFKENGLYEIIY